MSSLNDSPNIPTHLGLILDGNRRWGKSKGLTLMEAYKSAYENLKVLAEAALKKGVKYLSVFAFSTENWNRSPEEISTYMELLYWVVTKEVDTLHEQNIRVRFMGTPEGLSEKILKALKAAEEKTAKNTGGTLVFCLNYGGQKELADAAAKMISSGVKAEDVNPEKLAEFLYAPDVPSLDLIVRTSGEQRLSGFMLWRSAYAELLFVDKRWPEFGIADLDAALAEYASRQRRFGK
jgi:undecaprenyl diphosphate synthase